MSKDLDYIADLERENRLVKSFLYCTVKSCDNCGKVKCENFQMQRKDYCEDWVSFKDYINGLEQENATLKARLNAINLLTPELKKMSKLKKQQLTKAKELLNEFTRISKASDEDFEHDYSELIGEAEQFLKEFEIQEDRLCEHCDQYKSCPDGKRCRTCDDGSKWKRSKELC